MANVQLYINDVTNLGSDWTGTGTSPYLDSQNYPTSYISNSGRNKVTGDLGFANSSDLGTISSVTLYVYGQDGSSGDCEAYANATATGLNLPTTMGWVNVDVTAIVGTTWDNVNAATIHFDRSNNTRTSIVDAAYLDVEYTAGAATETNVHFYEM